ncbi:MAG: bifunctional UDP-N-acetylmuramoyl-tripeptide:D-alanyl-D-alanine ligase/alanine racemase [Chitinophagaceae bacterium]|nr:bifunctional UDP-N-acetylmuramoyl-tripeptide:D-alanyl-D-alanine ligase/alanine racemase [Chitinophagaceae bacterium]
MTATYHTSVLAAMMQATQHGSNDVAIRYLSVDSRRLAFPAETLFVAIDTAQRSGHSFIPDAYLQGVRVFLCHHLPEKTMEDAVYLQVPDTLTALQQLAAAHRRQFHCSVIGITGSNGKTIVKEWLYEVLHHDVQIARSPKSYNSQIGVPLSVWLMQPDTQLAIIEAGISQRGEMQALQSIIQPTIGIFTMLGDAHAEGFATVEEKLQEKWRLFQSCTAIICNTDDAAVAALAKSCNGQLLNWGHHDGAWLQVLQISKEQSCAIVDLLHKAEQHSLRFPFADDASIMNAMHVLVYMLYAGYNWEIIQQRIEQLRPLDMRMQWKKGIRHCNLLNDSYSNDFTSLVQAIELLFQPSRNAQRSIVLSDLSVGNDNLANYQQLLQLLQTKAIHRLITVGPVWQQALQQSGTPPFTVHTFMQTSELLAALPQLHFEREDILIKGGRQFALEKVAQQLEAQQHQTVLEIHLPAVQHNLQFYKKHVQPGVKMMAMVKASGYGSGDAEIARALQFSRVDYLAVAYPDEGVALRQAGIHLPIMVLNTDPDSFDVMEQYNLEPEVYSFELLQALQEWCKQRGIQSWPVHIKVDTGMHRLGFAVEDVPMLLQLLQQQQVLQVRSVFTHLVASEDAAADAFTQEQIRLFSNACSLLSAGLGYSFIQHCANTAAILRHPTAHFDMVRLGVGLYGGTPGLQPVMKLYTTVAQVKKVAAGETVGYGRKAVLQRPSVIATVRIGYADGYPRQLGNGVGSMWLHGQTAPVVGNVCMDMTMLDVTDLPPVQPGDLVEVFGDHISIQAVAGWCHTITYEIMTGISQRVKRVYIEAD